MCLQQIEIIEIEKWLDNLKAVKQNAFDRGANVFINTSIVEEHLPATRHY